MAQPQLEIISEHDPLQQFRNAKGISDAIRRAADLLRPPPDMLPSEWAEANVRVPLGNAVPGPIRFDNAPYQVEPLDQLVNALCYRVSLMWGAQVGKTLLALCAQGYCIDATPMSQMMMQPSEGDLKTWLETKFNPLVESNKVLSRKIAKPRGRDGVNNQKMKSYPGGFLMFAWSGSPRTMRGRSAPVIVCDEVDGYDATSEGHPVNLLWQRAATFGDMRFLLEISTPTTKDYSYIEKSFLAGDQRRFYIICPEETCKTHQLFVWENVRWIGRESTGIDDAAKDAGREDHQPETARYMCSCCGTLMDDGQRIAAVRTATKQGAGWKASKPFKGHASYHLNEMYSTLVRLQTIVQSYLDKLNDDDLQTFVNVSLAQTWAEKGEKADATGLYNRAETYRAQVPAGGLYLTAGIDMQPDRLEVEIVAWGLGEQSWSVDYVVIWGDPDGPDVWADLDDLLGQTFLHESGAQLAISAACLDTGGTNGNTQSAYEYARGKTGRRLFAVKGQGGWGLPVIGAPKRKQTGKRSRNVDLFMIGVDEAKLIVMRRLAVQAPGPGYCHFPADRSQEWFDQLTAEKLVTRYEKGFPLRKWTKPDHARNEALDCRVYALAALKIMNPSLKRLAERLKVPDDMKRRATKAETVPFNDVMPAPAQREIISPEAKKPLNLMQKNALDYVRNTNGGATVANFVDDHEPIGQQLWAALLGAGQVAVDQAGRICLALPAAQPQRQAQAEKPHEEETAPDIQNRVIKRSSSVKRKAKANWMNRY